MKTIIKYLWITGTKNGEAYIDVETVFADIKYNQKYDRFRLRGLKKIKIEWGLIAISHNLKKVALQHAAWKTDKIINGATKKSCP